MAEIVLDDVTKRFADGFEAVKDMNLEIADGEFMILVGPSGCGKSTALRMIAGLEDITDGELRIGGEVVNEQRAEGPRHRDGVPELRALPAHDGAREHGLRAEAAKAPKAEIDQKVEEAARILDLTQHLDRKPAQPLRRPAPAGRDGAGDRARPEGVPDGRAALEPRREAARADAHRGRRGSSSAWARRRSTSPTTRPRR